MPSFLPTQIGYLPTGVTGGLQTSTVFIGRFTSGTAPYEGVGLGAAGRPDYVEKVQINLTEVLSENGENSLRQKAQININISDVLAIQSGYENMPTVLNMKLQHTLICSNGLTSGMMILGSQPYSIDDPI